MRKLLTALGLVLALGGGMAAARADHLDEAVKEGRLTAKDADELRAERDQIRALVKQHREHMKRLGLHPRQGRRGGGQRHQRQDGNP